MTELNQDMQRVLDAHDEAPPRVIDPRTNKAYVLLAAEQYERIKALLEHDGNLSDTYPAQMDAAMQAGWGDASMNDYDHYDELRR